MISSKYFPAVGFGKEEAYNKLNVMISGDGNTACDLGSFTCTEMDDYAQKIYLDNIDKNLINANEYESTSKIEAYLGEIIADLFHMDSSESIFSRSTAGSSEAIGMAMLIHKQLWMNNQENPYQQDSKKPNIVFCSDAHPCWHKFARYFSIEAREVALRDDGHFPFNEFLNCIDEGTIVAVMIAGSTYTGGCDPVNELCDLLAIHNHKRGIKAGVHVDAAVGGFVLPFIDKNKDYIWDFRNPLVQSINVSNHKFGLVYSGLGWLVCRRRQDFIDELSYCSDYLFGEPKSFALNLSRPASPILVQYYSFLRYGFNGYRDVMHRCNHLTKVLKSLLESDNIFTVVVSSPLPIVAFTFTHEQLFKVSEYVNILRKRGWMLACYKLKTPSEPMVMRIVVRNSCSLSHFKRLYSDLCDVQKKLAKALLDPENNNVVSLRKNISH